MDLFAYLEQFSIQCRKTKAKVIIITLTSHKKT